MNYCYQIIIKDSKSYFEHFFSSLLKINQIVEQYCETFLDVVTTYELNPVETIIHSSKTLISTGHITDVGSNTQNIIIEIFKINIR